MSFLNKSEEYSPACDYIEPFVRPSKVFYIPDHFEQTTPNIKDKTLFPMLQESLVFQNHEKYSSKAKKINWKKQTKAHKIQWGSASLPKIKIEIDLQTFQCPYFDDHKLKLTRDVCSKNDDRILKHLTKCRNFTVNNTNPKIFKKSEKIVICDFSKYHHIEKSSFKDHLKDCAGFKMYCLTK